MGEPARDYRVWLFELASELQMNVSELAEATGMPVSFVSNVLNRRKHVSAMYLGKLVMAMSARAEQLGRTLTSQQLFEILRLAAEDPELNARRDKRVLRAEQRAQVKIARLSAPSPARTRAATHRPRAAALRARAKHA